MYIHGYGSEVKESDIKYDMLTAVGDGMFVFPYAPNYDNDLNDEFIKAREFAINNRVDLVVGTSFGGYMASIVGAELDLPYVCINPVIDPYTTLNKLNSPNIPMPNSLPIFDTSGFGLVLLNLGDEVLDSFATKDFIGNALKVITFSGGDHRFTNIDDAFDPIDAFFMEACLHYGRI